MAPRSEVYAKSKRIVDDYPCAHCGASFVAPVRDHARGLRIYCSVRCNLLEKHGSDYERINSKPNNALKSRRSMERNPEKVQARQKCRKAVKAGKLTRLPCEGCGTTQNVHGHHEDYSKPLDVRWLCMGCHYILHHGTPHPSTLSRHAEYAFFVVTPSAPWNSRESRKLLGKPATHLVVDPGNGRTLCGNNPDKWLCQGKGPISEALIRQEWLHGQLCATCVTRFEKLTAK